MKWPNPPENGFLDKDSFLYDKDTDLNFRPNSPVGNVFMFRRRCPSCAYATSHRLSDLHVYYHTRNLEFVWIKNMPFETMLRFAHQKVIQELGSLCYLCEDMVNGVHFSGPSEMRLGCCPSC